MDTIWSAIFGNPDLGPVTFPTLVRRRSPNDALVCPRTLCSSATPDREPPIFPLPAARLRAIVDEVLARQPRTTVLEQGRQARYLVRSPILRFPDTVNVEVVDLGAGRATVALYSRSQIGRGDLGANRRRLERWLARIAAATARG
jgi:uncharacterized protein (DUF1499 family)